MTRSVVSGRKPTIRLRGSRRSKQTECARAQLVHPTPAACVAGERQFGHRAMFGWGEPKRPRVVAFDAIETMFPLDPLRPSLMALGLPWAGLEGWYATAVRDALALTASGNFKPFTTVLEGALDQVLGEQGLAPPRAARQALLAQFKHLPARADARAALCLVAQARMRPILLTNSNEVPVAAIGAGAAGGTGCVRGGRKVIQAPS